MRTDEEVKAFLSEVIEVCKKHGMSISHEDWQGGFEVENASESNYNWLSGAANKTEIQVVIDYETVRAAESKANFKKYLQHLKEKTDEL